ncbi:MAG TPA: class I SAM-dependent methyltransferase [Gaiellaceae bacterium]|nr:class I SAM-dependent methyltransferase [Gaiellaceae bacterium]
MEFEDLKKRQSAVWGAAPFERVAAEIADVHDDLVERLEPLDGVTFLDVACGTGGVAERAAARGAEVTGADFAEALIATARRRAEEQGLRVRFDVADAEQLPYGDESFDVVASCFGVMFAPNQRAAANELRRVCRSGGRLGLACWTPDGTIGDFFRLASRFQPPPPAGAGNPLEWGTEERVRELLGDAFELEFVKLETPQTGESGDQLWELFSTSFGPTKTLADSLPEDRRAELRDAYVGFWESYRTDDGIVQPRQYLVTLGRRRP